jgi:hypothetical protein
MLVWKKVSLRLDKRCGCMPAGILCSGHRISVKFKLPEKTYVFPGPTSVISKTLQRPLFLWDSLHRSGNGGSTSEQPGGIAACLHSGCIIAYIPKTLVHLSSDAGLPIPRIPWGIFSRYPAQRKVLNTFPEHRNLYRRQVTTSVRV